MTNNAFILLDNEHAVAAAVRTLLSVSWEKMFAFSLSILTNASCKMEPSREEGIAEKGILLVTTERVNWGIRLLKPLQI